MLGRLAGGIDPATVRLLYTDRAYRLHDVAATVVSVPEPGTAAALLLAGGALGRRRRSRGFTATRSGRGG